MRVTFNHDNEKRSITLIPEDELEILVLTQIHDRVAKGQTVQIGKVVTPEGPIEFRFEVKVNGHKGRVDRKETEEVFGTRDRSLVVSGRGNANPKVMLVADSCQGEDLTTGYALAGYKEQIIKGFCRDAGIRFDDLYLTAFVKEELPKVSWKGKKKPSEAETARENLKHLDLNWATILRDEIVTLKPNLVVPLGELGFQLLSSFEGIRKFRGSVLKINPMLRIDKYTKILPILGPYPYLYSEYKLKFISQVDFLKIPKWSGHEEIPDDTYRVWWAKSAAEVRNYFNRQYDTCLKSNGFVVFDIESWMNVPTCISFCFDGFESCCIPFLDSSIDRDNRVLMLDLVYRLLASPLPKVNQNIKYDQKTMERWGFRVNNIIGDTMLAASAIYCEFPKNLGFLTSIYTDIPYFKDEGHGQFDPSRSKKDQLYLYNAKDSLATHQIYTKQMDEVKEMGVSYVYESLIKLMPIYRMAEDRGLRIDAEKRDKLLAKYESLYRVHKLTLCRLANQDNLNPLSSTAMQTLIFNELGYNRIRGVTGGDEESIQMLMAKGKPQYATMDTGRAVLQEIIWCRKIHKVIEILELPIYPDGRFRGEFNLAGTETGRSSGSKTSDYHIDAKDTAKGQKIKIKNIGHSLQTIGKHGFYIGDELYGEDVRDYFVPSNGYRFVEIDLAGAEARVDRVLSGNFDMSVFDNPGIHKFTGSLVFGCNPKI